MKHLLSSIIFLLLSTLAFGQVPNTFSSGETISSSKINANFSFLANAMGNGKLQAMMVCRDRWIGDLENNDLQDLDQFTSPNIVFSNCIVPDNTTLRNLKACNYENTIPQGMCRYPSNVERAIFSRDLIDNGWILSFIERITNSENYIYYLFYKISSD